MYCYQYMVKKDEYYRKSQYVMSVDIKMHGTQPWHRFEFEFCECFTAVHGSVRVSKPRMNVDVQFNVV